MREAAEKSWLGMSVAARALLPISFDFQERLCRNGLVFASRGVHAIQQPARSGGAGIATPALSFSVVFLDIEKWFRKIRKSEFKLPPQILLFTSSNLLHFFLE